MSEIIENVKTNGDKAVYDYTVKFDGKAPEKAEISADEIDAVISECDPKYIETVRRAAKNIEDFHKRQVQQSWLTTKNNGVIMGQRIRGLKRVGIYVPGGTAAYPSSVLMNAIPAKIAGVEEIVMCTPPMKNGKPNPNILAAAKLAGVDRIFLMGGAQAIAAMAYGTESVPKVDKIVGPGNIFVATAKKLLYGTVDIDMIAGPSEILIIADKSANPKFLAADLMSQAEHDKLASAILLTDCEELANQTVKELERQVQTLSRNEIINSSLDNFGAIIVCSDMKQAVLFANELAPEHLEVCCENPMEYVGKLDNAGSVFLGNYSPEPLGDYFAGPNHVLPTSGYLTQFGIWHDNDFTQFHLSSDLMEPFRTIVDEVAFSLPEGDKEFKRKMADILNFQISIDGKTTTLDLAVRTYVRSVLNALEASDPSLIIFPSYEL